jgi:hypothetical protein
MKKKKLRPWAGFLGKTPLEKEVGSHGQQDYSEPRTILISTNLALQTIRACFLG